MDYFIHEKAIVDSKNIGSNTKIWAFCNVLEGARIGSNCNICDGCFIEKDVVVGNNVTIKNGVYLYEGTVLEDDVFIGPNVTFTNDKYPRSKNVNYKMKGIIVKRGASVGGGAILLPGINIGEYSMVGAGSVVTKDVPDYSVVYGNPAVVKGKIDQSGKIVQ